MTSNALREWNGDRCARLDDLAEVHARVGGTGAGRRRGTDQLNWAATLRVAAEFQGFARDLHDETTDFFVTQAAATNTAIKAINRSLLTQNRKIDTGNAQPSALGADFGRFGIRLWPALRAQYPARTGQWNTALETLNTARNGIAHADESKISEVATLGWDLRHLDTAKRFRAHVSSLAQGLDKVMERYLIALFGGAKPW